MAGIHICERDGCNAMIKGRALGGITLALSADDRTEPAQRIIRAELCPACVEDIYSVLMHAPIGDRQRAYDRPFNPSVAETEDALSGVTNEQLAAALLTRMMSDPAMRKAIGGTVGEGKNDGK